MSRNFESMNTLKNQRRRTAARFSGALLASSLVLPSAVAQQQRQETLELRESVSETVAITSPGQAPAQMPIPTAPIQAAYILGPGDAVVVELLDVPEYSGVFTIGPDGTLYLPRLRSLFVERLTVE